MDWTKCFYILADDSGRISTDFDIPVDVHVLQNEFIFPMKNGVLLGMQMSDNNGNNICKITKPLMITFGVYRIYFLTYKDETVEVPASFFKLLDPDIRESYDDYCSCFNIKPQNIHHIDMIYDLASEFLVLCKGCGDKLVMKRN